MFGCVMGESLAAVAGRIVTSPQGPLTARSLNPFNNERTSGVRVTLQDVATDCGCSKATVSMALRGHPRIATATRARVQAAARTLGYVPDPGLSRIARLRWRSRAVDRGLALALVSGNARAHRGSSAAVARAAALGFLLQPWSLTRTTAPALAEQLLLRGQRGVILTQIQNAEQLAGFPWSEFCAVACGIGAVVPAIHVVKADPFRAMDLAWTHAVAAGHRRIGVAITRHPLSWNEEQALGLALVRQRGLPRDHRRIPPLCVNGSDREPLRRWLARWQPSVLIANDDLHPQLLADVGWPVPRRLHLIVLNKSQPQDGRAGVDMNFHAIATAAVDLLAQELTAHRYGLPQHQQIVHLAPQWIPGASFRED